MLIILSPVAEPVDSRLLSLSKHRALLSLNPGLNRNLSKQSAAKTPFYALNRGRCHLINPCLPHPRPPEADFIPDHYVHDTGVELYDTDDLRGDVLVHVVGDGDVGEAVANEFPAGRKAIFGGVEDFGIAPRWKFRRKMTQVVSYESDPPFRRKVTHLS